MHSIIVVAHTQSLKITMHAVNVHAYKCSYTHTYVHLSRTFITYIYMYMYTIITVLYSLL